MEADHTSHDCCAHHGHHHELVIEGLSVSYRNILALSGVSMATSCGNRVALIGPNGAGKSTLLKAIAGLVPRASGEIRWRGTAVRKWSREFAYLPQNPLVRIWQKEIIEKKISAFKIEYYVKRVQE